MYITRSRVFYYFNSGREIKSKQTERNYWEIEVECSSNSSNSTKIYSHKKCGTFNRTI